MHEVAGEFVRNVSDTEQLANFFKSGYLTTEICSDDTRCCFGEEVHQLSGQYENKVQNVFATDSFVSSGDQRNGSFLISGNGEDGDGIQVGKVILLFKVRVRGSSKVRNTHFCVIPRRQDRYRWWTKQLCVLVYVGILMISWTTASDETLVFRSS